GADGQLNRLQAAGPGGNVEDVAVQEVEHAGRHFAADDLLLIGDDIHDFEGGGLHQTKVDRDVHHEHLAGDQARAAVLFHFAAGDVEAARADVVVHLGDAADDVEVRARHLTRQDAAEGGVLGRAVRHVVADQLVVGVAQLQLRHRGVVALDDAGAGLGQRGVRHQGRALGD